jgi:uncharacterized membrane protein (DUF4010 family)
MPPPDPPGRPVPVATPAPAEATVVQRTTTTVLPDTDFASPGQVAALRVWAAAVRDRQGAYSGAFAATTVLGRLLCAELDLLEQARSLALRDLIQENVRTLAVKIRGRHRA